jgi:hypothetical protein
MNKFIKIHLIFIFIFFVNFFIFNLFFISKRYFFPQIIFYEGIYSSILSSIIVYLIIIFFWKNKKILNLVHPLYHLVISFLFIIIFHTNIITIVDRSISIFMLNELYNNNYNKEQITHIFASKFPSYAIEKRLNEQIEIKNIKINLSLENKETYHITNKGEVYIKLFKKINKLYNLDKLILEGEDYE